MLKGAEGLHGRRKSGFPDENFMKMIVGLVVGRVLIF
jgi:hypothetical protein